MASSSSAHIKIVAAAPQSSSPGLAKATTERADMLREMRRSGRVSYGQLARAWRKENDEPISWQRAAALVNRPNGPDSARLRALPAPIREALGVKR